MRKTNPNTISLKCSALRADGLPCQAWARRHGKPPRCKAHTPDVVNFVVDSSMLVGPALPAGETDPVGAPGGLYVRNFTLQEIADLVNKNAENDLTDELAAARVTVHRVLKFLEESLTPSEFAHLAQVIFNGTSTIVRLLQAQHDLADPLTDRFHLAIGLALDEISEEWNFKL